MEKERFFGNSNHLLIQMNPPPSYHLLQPSFLNLNWDQSMDHISHHHSGLSSIVSSPAAQTPTDTVTAPETAALGELIGRLGSFCNSGEISSQSLDYLSGYCNEPLNSSPKLHLPIQPNLPISGNSVVPLVHQNHLSPFSADPVYAEGAVRFPRLGVGNCGEYQMVVSEIPMKYGSQLEMETRSNKFGTPPVMSKMANDNQLGGGRGELPALGHSNSCSGSNTRKRKASENGRAKEFPRVAEEENLNGKRSKSSEVNGETKDDVKMKVGSISCTNSGNGDLRQEKDNDLKPSEPPKQDYIHVRARRGQATDNHSLAERVRREKISERMKFLQDLVPGCNKVTGKAVMLDEIINYVQSLQCQVAFLSMKLASVNHRMDFDMESLLQKEIHQSRWSLPCLHFPTEISAPVPPFAPQPSQTTPCPMNPSESNNARKSLGLQFPTFDERSGDFDSEIFWNNDLQDVVVKMNSAMNTESSCPSLVI